MRHEWRATRETLPGFSRLGPAPFRFAGKPRWRTIGLVLMFTVSLVFVVPQAYAAVTAETQFILNSFSFLIWGALVMWMCAGFTMLEAGSVRTKNASVICLKNIGLYSIAGLTYYLVGYNLMYVDVVSWVGSFALPYSTTPEEIALLGGDEAAAEAVIGNGYSTMSDWFFQMVFVATTASIVSGTLAERVKLWSFFIFIALLTAFIYPVIGSWTWGGGWLAAMGFQDLAGSTVVHSTGGWAALAAVLVVGSRRDKFRPDGTVRQTPPNNVPMVTLGAFVVWMGFLAFNAGSHTGLTGASDAVALSNIFVNSTLAGAAGVVAAVCLSRWVLGRIDLFASLNGGIAGLVAIAAAPGIPTHLWAVVIGGIGGVLCLLGIRLLERLKIDDEVGAIPAHLGAGLWGTLAVCIDGGGDPLVQILGMAAIGGFVFVVSVLAWLAIEFAMGCRISEDVERLGQDAALGMETFPEFLKHDDDE